VHNAKGEIPSMWWKWGPPVWFLVKVCLDYQESIPEGLFRGYDWKWGPIWPGSAWDLHCLAKNHTSMRRPETAGCPRVGHGRYGISPQKFIKRPYEEKKTTRVLHFHCASFNISSSIMFIWSSPTTIRWTLLSVIKNKVRSGYFWVI
jgi:hypothetical protein